MLGQHVKDGIELHRMTEGRWDDKKGRRVGRKPTGEIYWKLAVPCSFCGDLIDECLCYGSKKDFEVAKDRARTRGYYCSSVCWFRGMDMEHFEYWTKQYNISRKDCCWDYPPLSNLDMAEKIEQLSEWFEEMGAHEDFSMSEDLGAEECPI